MMRSLAQDSDALDALAFDRASARIARECGLGPVSMACQNAVQALSRYWGLLSQGPCQSAVSEVRAAGAAFELALATVKTEPCRSHSDGRAKWMTLELVASLFPHDDCRIGGLRGALIKEMAELFQVDAPFSALGVSQAVCTCCADSLVVG
jgi:hypothetical protein